MQFPFVGQAYQSRSPNVNAQRCVNMYPELDPTGKSVLALYATPGKVLLGSIGTGPIRALHAVGSSMYVVSGNEVYKVGTGYTGVLLGSMATNTGSVSIEDNGTYLLIVDGTGGYVVTLSSGAFQDVSDVDFPPNPVKCAVIDQYFIVVEGGTQRFWLSTDGVSWDGTDFASAEGSPDNLVSCLADHRELWLFGEQTTEVWANTGNADFPFERIQGAFIESGCAATYSVAKADNSVFWLMQDAKGWGMVYRAQGYVGQRISTHAIETAISNYATVSDAIGFCYQQDGHTFYVLTFPTESKTWVFDISTSMWHERAYMDPSTGALSRDLANCYTFFNGRHTVGDYRNNRLYELDLDTYTDNGDYIKALRSCEYLDDENALMWILHHRLQVDVQSGVGLSAGQGSNPQMMLRWSDDGGHTWSNEHWTSLGLQGQYLRRAIWRRLGKSRARVYEVSITDPVQKVVIAANVQATKTRA